MLVQLEARDAEQQRFAANASHELRTPLAITQTLLDVARNDPNRDGGELDERPSRCQHTSDRTHRGTAPTQPVPTSVPSAEKTLICRSSRKKPPRRSSRSRRSRASPSRPTGTSRRSSAHTRTCCS
ncbi:histidine kinase dimerization/phospho-acceptor domain-containing protein [Rhodococcus sp. OK302]|uniref:histidine kinase dimerization/phospho-acceptor domain-containing protein n=1 Tax=Rhodococcus sp. OK302 TaxID=1882769 RepID=UPI0034E868DC